MTSKSVTQRRLSKERREYEIRVADDDRIPNETRGLNVRTLAYSKEQALSGYLKGINKLYLYERLLYGFLHNEGVEIVDCGPAITNRRKRIPEPVQARMF